MEWSLVNEHRLGARSGCGPSPGGRARRRPR